MAWAQKLIGHKWVSNLGNDTKKIEQGSLHSLLDVDFGRKNLLGLKHIKIVSWHEWFGHFDPC